jgi:hypothetical protein
LLTHHTEHIEEWQRDYRSSTNNYPLNGSNLLKWRHNLKIPKKIVLAGIPINVRLIEEFAKQNNCLGASDYSNQQIVVDSNHCPKELTEQTFCHEKVHWILHIMGEHELNKNEQFVDLFAHLLYQSMETEEHKKRGAG